MRRAASDENLAGKPKVPSEKHDVLFSKARYVLNQRHIKRPWFNLNPFLEKTDENIDLENFFPGESKYIQPLESLVLCESFHNEKPVDTKEMSIESFFPYLFSTDWDKGCSLRILEGQLLDEILLGLYRLEKEGSTVRHTTHALARNHRPRTGSYNMDGSTSNFTETLLIEFAHFGHLIKEKPNRKTQDAFEYLKLDKRNEEISPKTKSLPKLPEETETPAKRQRKAINNDNAKHTKCFSSSTSSDKSKLDRNKSLIVKHVKAICFLKALNSDNKSQPYPVLPPIQQNKRQSLVTADSKSLRRQSFIPGALPKSENRRHTIIDKSYLSTNRRQSFAVPQSVMQRAQLSFKYMGQKRQEKARINRLENRDNIKFNTPDSEVALESKTYSLDFEDDCISEQTSVVKEDEPQQEKKDVFFGEEFYLSDYKGNCKHNLKSATKILGQKRKEFQERRKEIERLKENEAMYKNTHKLPELSALDNKTVEAYRMYNETIKMPDEVPTLEEFVKLLKKDEYYDPRYRNKVRTKGKKIAERYFMAKETYKSPSLYKTANTRDCASNICANQLGSCKSVRSTLSKLKDSTDEIRRRPRVRLPALYQSYRATRNIHELSEKIFPDSSSDIHQRGKEVLGVTDSEPCKNHFIKCKRQIKDRSSLKNPLFPKIALVSDDDIESLDSESEETLSAERLNESFDVYKLNLRYSIERIRKKRRSKVKKKQGFIGVLAKYYNMQNKQTSDEKETKKVVKGAKSFGKKKQKVKQCEEEKQMVIGQMKKFKFLNAATNKRKLNLESIPRGDFTSSNLAKFHQHLKEALNIFVVRREIVVSDLNKFYNATTTVTFTKQSCFQLEQKNEEMNGYNAGRRSFK